LWPIIGLENRQASSNPSTCLNRPAKSHERNNQMIAAAKAQRADEAIRADDAIRAVCWWPACRQPPTSAHAMSKQRSNMRVLPSVAHRTHPLSLKAQHVRASISTTF
jgi:hypothetical protein